MIGCRRCYDLSSHFPNILVIHVHFLCPVYIFLSLSLLALSTNQPTTCSCALWVTHQCSDMVSILFTVFVCVEIYYVYTCKHSFIIALLECESCRLSLCSLRVLGFAPQTHCWPWPLLGMVKQCC